MPVSTMRPAYMTLIRSHMPAAMPRSWVISSTAVLNSSDRRLDQLQDLRLDGHVEGGRRLVGEQQLGVARQGDGDHHALAHAARELERVVVEAVRGTRDADLGQQLDHAILGRLGRQAHVLADRLGDLVADGERRIEAGERVLEDEADVLAAQPAHLLGDELEQVDALEQDLARRRSCPADPAPGASATGP